jgi:hypothetical protein
MDHRSVRVSLCQARVPEALALAPTSVAVGAPWGRSLRLKSRPALAGRREAAPHALRHQRRRSFNHARLHQNQLTPHLHKPSRNYPAARSLPRAAPLAGAAAPGGHRTALPRGTPAGRPFATNQAPNRPLVAHRPLPYHPPAGLRRSPAGIAAGPPLPAPEGPHCETEALSEGLPAKW